MPIAAPPGIGPDSITSKNLGRLLSHLDQKLGSPLAGGEVGILTPPSSLERTKIAAVKNLDYARQLLHKLESGTSAITVPSKRQKTLADLGTQKQTIRRLNESLHFASQVEEDGADQEGGGSSGTESEGAEQSGEPENDDYARLSRPKHQPAPKTDVKQEPLKALPPPSSTLRNRFSKTDNEKHKELFGGRGDAEATPKAVLDDHMKAQEDITNDLLNMAKMLKESSMEFNRSLEGEKGYLDQAKAGLDRNAMGMQSAGKRMDDLQKNETVSFYWSIIYLVSIVVLAFFILFVLFFAPKLRW